jgi:ferrous iron transport protein A
MNESSAQPLSSPLSEVTVGQVCRVVSVQAPAGSPDWPARLADIGFVAGERVQVLRRGMPGGEPLAVQVGSSVFALRRAEAACIEAVSLADGSAW